MVVALANAAGRDRHAGRLALRKPYAAAVQQRSIVEGDLSTTLEPERCSGVELVAGAEWQPTEEDGRILLLPKHRCTRSIANSICCGGSGVAVACGAPGSTGGGRERVCVYGGGREVKVTRPSECDDVIRRAHVSRSRGLPHREGTDGLRRPPF